MEEGVVGLESDGLAEFCSRRAVVPLDVLQDGADGVVGVGEIGLDADGNAVLGDRLIELPLRPRSSQRLSWEAASSGWRRMAVRYAAIASSRFPC